MTESESKLCSAINLAEMRIDYALKEYNQCKNAAFLAGTKWDEEMTEDEQINFCLKGMDSSLDRCELIEDEELEEELFNLC